MNIAEVLERRRAQWRELDELCQRMQSRRRGLGAADVTRFASLYRAACADLALADAYHLPQGALQYLHRLVGRAHNQLYRSRRFRIADWSRIMFRDTPRRIFRDGCVQAVFVLFWLFFLASAMLAHADWLWPGYAESILGKQQVDQLKENFAQPITGRNAEANYLMAAFYIQHNTSIGLQAFAGGLFVIPGLFTTVFNAVVLGGSFGYMARPEVTQGVNFYHFVTAHGPFELTAIVLSAGAGLRLGLSWMWTNGLTRRSSLRKGAQESMPILGAAIVLFFLAALLEGFLSPSAAPYSIKALAAVLSSGVLIFYFVVLGYQNQEQEADHAT